MGVMDKFLKVMKLNDEEEYYDEDYYDEEEEEEIPVKRGASRARDRQVEEEYEEKTAKKAAQPKVTYMRQPSAARKAPASGTGMEVCVIKPTSVEEAREVTETLLSNRTVVLNLEGLDVDVAQRIIDFTSGSCFAISGNLQKISNYIFIITPSTVDISGDFQDILSGAFSNGPIDSGM